MEAYELPQGMITVSCCNEELSIGTLTLRPHQSLDKHNRPVEEELLQLYGTCTMKLFEDGEPEEVRLEEGDTLSIPANQYHIHANGEDEDSVTLWKFEGDIQDIIQEIRNQFEPV